MTKTEATTETKLFATSIGARVTLTIWNRIDGEDRSVTQTNMTALQAEVLAKQLLDAAAELPRVASAADLGLAA